MADHIQMGDPAFSKMLLVLSAPVTQRNHKEFKFLDQEMQEIAEDIWAMPAYMEDDDDYSSFFIFTKIDTGETVAAFAEGQLEGEQFSLSQPMPTGEGLNRLFVDHPDRAKRVLKFLNDISKADEGSWRQIDDADV